MMISRRDALGSLPLALFFELAASAAHARSQATQPAQGAVFTHDLPDLTMDDWQVTASYVDYPPGRVGNPHRHPGFVLAYVLEGAVIAKISGQDERTYTAGQMFFEPPGSVHEVSRNASQTKPARLLAMIFAKKGVPLTAPA
jgi:quercetin dioxygenase-like cupin family protein